MRVALLLSAVGMMSFAGVVAAQRCPQGLAGMPDCVPPSHPARQGATGGRPVAVWVDRWGAMAMGKNGSGFSSSEQAVSKRAAMADALNACRVKGGKDCKVIVHYSNQCAALAWGTSYWVTWRAPTIEEASVEGIRACAKETDDCRIMYAACSLPQRVR